VAHAMNGPLGAGEAIENRVMMGLESLKELQDYAQAQGVRLASENLPLFLDCGVVSLAVLRAITNLDIGVCLDTCHASMHTPSGLPLMEELAPRVWYTHISDTKGDHDSHLIPGEGSVDFPVVARLLGQAGFDGVVDLECSLWMLRYRYSRNELQPGDPAAADVPWITTEQYLAQAAKAGWRIAGMIEQARTERTG
jgi:sugar phosphate isomerase/epimerase